MDTREKTQGSYNKGPILEGILHKARFMVILKDVPCNSVLFGAVM